MKEILEMSKKEIDRYKILQKLLEKQITQTKAAELLDLKSDRQVRNLLQSYRKLGISGLVSQQRGKQSNRAFDTKFKKRVMVLIRERYSDFGPTFAKEKLLEYHNITISDETLRQWMIEEHLWISRRKKPSIHPLRARRDYFGELIQIDGSHHYWFEDRADKCVLIVFIDDATSKITSLFFCKTECLQSYFKALEMHLIAYGRPLGLYSDRHAIFGGGDKIHHAQFKRAIKELEIEGLLARTPQAKGRVERANKTLQDRLVKEMRLRNICNIEDANRYLPEFIRDFNKKFSKEPKGKFDAHRSLEGYDFDRILTRCEERTLSKDLVFSFNNRIYKIMQPEMNYRLRGKKITVRLRSDGVIKVYFKCKELKYEALDECLEEKLILNSKEKLAWVPNSRTHPSNNHPWKKYGYQIPLKNKLSKAEKSYYPAS
jgi:Helix-turn-helix domain